MRDIGDLADRHRAPLWTDHGAVDTAHLARLALQQMRPDALDLVTQDAACTRYRTACHDHAARGKRAKAEGAAFGIAVPH